jgi:hypothetical protein
MKLKELKSASYRAWELVQRLEDTVIQPKNFWKEVHGYGDLRCRATWEKIYAVFQASVIANPVLENCGMIQIYFCHPTSPELVCYNDLVLEEFLKYPTALDRIKDGLEQLYYQPAEPEDQQDAVYFLKRIAGYQSSTDILQGMALALAA